MKICLCTLLVLVAGVAADASAQAQSFTDLQSALKPGQTVTVLDDKGNKTQGRVSSITTGQLEIVEGEGRRAEKHLFTESSVRRIRKDDSNWNGMFIGLAAGTLLGVWSCTGDDAEGCPNEGAAVAVVGGVIGYYVDDLIHPTVYLAKTQVAVSIVPLLSPGRLGVAASLRF